MHPTEKLMKKWGTILENEDLPKIESKFKRATTAVLLENYDKESRGLVAESTSAEPTNVTGGVSRWDPILVSLTRRAAPNLMAFDLAGVQPMTGPTGLLFALRARYNSQQGAEALYNEADTAHSGTGSHTGDSAGFPADHFGTGTPGTSTGYGEGMDTETGEVLGTEATSPGPVGSPFKEMAFTIDKTSVEAVTRALKAEYSIELAQDLRALHGLDAETELTNILSTEIIAEINRQLIRTINVSAVIGARDTAAAKASPSVLGKFDLATDSDGRWSKERWFGLMYQIEREANQIAKDTRRGKGNIIVCSSNVASALSLSGMLDYTPQLSTNLQVDDTGNTFAGVLLNRFRVYVDPYADVDYITVGYKGTSPFDAGIFYCPYVPLQMVKAIGEDSFQPKLGFKTRYAIKANPFVETDAAGDGLGQGENYYYRKFRVFNILATQA